MLFLEINILNPKKLHTPAIGTALLVLSLLDKLEYFLDSWHRQLLVKSVKCGRAGAPVLSFTIGCVILLHTLLLLFQGFQDGLSPFINSSLEFLHECLVSLDIVVVLV